MRKLILPVAIVFALFVGLTSCGKEPEVKKCTNCGTYNGTVSGPIKIDMGISAVDLDTTFNNDLAATLKLADLSPVNNDSLLATITLTVKGVPINIAATAHRDGNKVTIKDFKYKALSVLDVLVNASGTADGTNANFNVKLTDPAGSGKITSNLDFTGKK